MNRGDLAAEAHRHREERKKTGDYSVFFFSASRRLGGETVFHKPVVRYWDR